METVAQPPKLLENAEYQKVKRATKQERSVSDASIDGLCEAVKSRSEPCRTRGVLARREE